MFSLFHTKVIIGQIDKRPWAEITHNLLNINPEVYSTEQALTSTCQHSCCRYKEFRRVLMSSWSVEHASVINTKFTVILHYNENIKFHKVH